ncbi:MAG: hypothetical protein ACRDNZ_09010 [Streptosporangiaceae bacterium]
MIPLELIQALAEAAAITRAGDPGWDEDAVTGALLATQNASPPWPAGRVWRELAQEVRDPNGHPRNLSRAASPLAANAPARPEIREAIAHAARAAMTRNHPDPDPEKEPRNP